MDKSFGQIVREKREERGLSQAELATLANTTQQSIDRIERDAVSRSRSAPEVAAALGIAFPLGTTAVRTAVEQAQQETIPRAELVGVNDLPIYVSVRAGSIDDSILVSPEPIDYVKRPEPLSRAKNGYGLYIVGDSMEPAFRQGDLALVHPNMHPKPGDEVVVCSVDVNGEHYAVIKLLTKITSDKWHLKQYNPGPDEPAEFTLDREEWPVCHLVVGSYRKR
ncbi:S24 family peptidase [Agrobacterium cavarae]|uniref:S24 family peptidase n=1 Tax=Agrobacterium cavarae TaxID=2528239 RepID=UPI003CFF6AFD